MHRYLTKSAPVRKFAPPEKGAMRRASVKFRPASEAELKAIGAEEKPDGFVAGWASTKDLDLYRHRVQPNAFAEAIQTRGLTGPRGVKLLVNHDWHRVAGHITKLEYRSGDLWIEAQMNLEISYAKDMYLAAKSQGGLSFSVGFMLEKYGVEGDEATGEWLRIDKGDLYEVSVVPFPANEDATMLFVKGLEASGDEVDAPDFATVAEFEKHLVASGIALSRNEAKRLTQVVKANVELFRKEPAGAPAAPPAPNTPPVLAVEKLQELSALAAQMKQTLAR